MNTNASTRRAGLRSGLAVLLALWALAVPAAATRPDPTSFGAAVEQGDLAAVGKWLDDGLDPDFMADRVGSGLMIAAWEGNVPMLELFYKHGARLDLGNRYDEQALQLAAWNGHLDAVKWLLAHGASVNRRGSHWGALHYAAFADRGDVVRLLLQHGGEVNARSPNGSTALMMTAREGHEAMAQLLLDAGADATLTNDDGDSALTWAMRHEQFSIARRVSSAADFSKAVRAAPESFGVPVRAQPAPPEIEELLRQIRLAETMGKPHDDLRKKLFDAIARFKKGSELVSIGRKPTGKVVNKGKPKALVITARRGRGKTGRERVELVYAPKEATLGGGTQSKTPSPEKSDVAPPGAGGSSGRTVPDILESIARARAAGKPVEDLRKALFEAVARFKHAPPGQPATGN